MCNLINQEYRSEKSMVDMVPRTERVVAIEVCDPFMLRHVGIDLNLMKIVQKYNIPYCPKVTNVNNINMGIWEKSLID